MKPRGYFEPESTFRIKIASGLALFVLLLWMLYKA